MSDFAYNTHPDFLQDFTRLAKSKDYVEFQQKLGDAALRLQWAKQDWSRNFSHRMSYDEYHYIAILMTQLAMNEIVFDRALDLLRKYRQENAKTP
jgi:hypothetical protein